VDRGSWIVASRNCCSCSGDLIPRLRGADGCSRRFLTMLSETDAPRVEKRRGIVENALFAKVQADKTTEVWRLPGSSLNPADGLGTD